MADANVTRLELAATGIRATIDALLNTRRLLERAAGDLGRERERRNAERIDAFTNGVKTAVVPADALKAQLELDALRKTFDDQEAALHYWEREVNDRLGRLAVDHWAEVLEALETQIAALRQLQSKEQGDVDEVKSVILEFDALRNELQLKRHSPAGHAGGGKRPGHKAEV